MQVLGRNKTLPPDVWEKIDNLPEYLFRGQELLSLDPARGIIAIAIHAYIQPGENLFPD